MDPDHRLRFGYRFVTLARRWRRMLDRALAAEGLTDASWSPLFHLDEGGDNISQSELAERIGLDSSSLVRLIDILEKRGFVQRVADPVDRRARLLLLTEAGFAKVGQIRSRLRALEAELLSDLSDDALKGGMRLFDEIGDRITALEKKD